ncbi:hypothetical protein JCM14635_13920 [Megalodesulfovibrio paquesii]
MGVDQPEAAQTPGTQAGAGQFGNVNGTRLTHDDHLGSALSVDEQAQLPAHAAGQDGQLPGLFRGVAALVGVAAGVQPRKGLLLAGLQTLKIALQFGGDGGAPGKKGRGVEKNRAVRKSPAAPDGAQGN